ncbi:hypothetical protein NSERUTF1_4345 [Nocardia seriolae]|nr:hypothetical protein NSERUTF1_4345 [Nocardia seriolae]
MTGAGGREGHGQRCESNQCAKVSRPGSKAIPPDPSWSGWHTGSIRADRTVSQARGRAFAAL